MTTKQQQTSQRRKTKSVSNTTNAKKPTPSLPFVTCHELVDVTTLRRIAAWDGLHDCAKSPCTISVGRKGCDRAGEAFVVSQLLEKAKAKASEGIVEIETDYHLSAARQLPGNPDLHIGRLTPAKGVGQGGVH